MTRVSFRLNQQLPFLPFLSGSGERRQAAVQIPLDGIWLVAAGIRSTEYGYTKIFTNEKQGAKIPLLKVLEILKNFFQEVFKQGLGQSPKVFFYHFYPVAERVKTSAFRWRNAARSSRK